MKRPEIDTRTQCVEENDKAKILSNSDSFLDIRDLMIRNLKYVLSKYKEYDSQMKEYVKSIEYKLGVLESEIAEMEDMESLGAKNTRLALNKAKKKIKEQNKVIHKYQLLNKKTPIDIQNYTISVAMFKEKMTNADDRIKNLKKDNNILKKDNNRLREDNKNLIYKLQKYEKTNNLVCSNSVDGQD